MQPAIQQYQPWPTIFQLLLKFAVFCLLAFVILNFVIGPIILHTSLGNIFDWYGPLEALNKSRHPDQSEVVYVGDSVGQQLLPRQIFPNSYMANGAKLVVGNTIICSNILSRESAVKHIVYISVPVALGQPFERERTYRNFMKPFFIRENFPHFSESLWTKIKEKPVAMLSLLPIIKVIGCFDDVNYSKGEAGNWHVLSALSIEYLKRLKTLADDAGVQLTFRAPPLPLSMRELTDDWGVMRAQAREHDLEGILGPYFDKIVYLEDDYFRPGILNGFQDAHLEPNYLQQHRLKLLQQLIPEDIYSISQLDEPALLIPIPKTGHH